MQAHSSEVRYAGGRFIYGLDGFRRREVPSIAEPNLERP